ncbi:hypothetical protein DDB_G0291422 [Dictyostelium discoideum AX4]|uniref:Putative uncharacterized protein DDB_G0291422 n=1 Tax=Dictyostelium discoideum TaxID=44689 RepID=Y3883_DICDI|nr:hypothetical protein DDB_G0291422 [Dictyostelium discoideum AX4]Q54EP0.1 RecName: Full=Putative uncharacterized protein DDB_G0291422 [Dictyostelium discoideum]EAL61695.1 hypothetical protein DDB_G0291422 [Dictyostelium discoideum AX4]|eukprot:XP_635200.1 hypothetical protein DDB_G0291422 [Dictyostelium discoideum AX4]
MRDNNNNNEKYLIDFLKKVGSMRGSYSGSQIVIFASKDKKDEKIEKKRKIKNLKDKIRSQKRTIELEVENRRLRDRIDGLKSGINELTANLENLKKKSDNQKKDMSY